MVSLNVVVAGLVAGSMYGLLALGYHITFIVSNTVNFSQGASLMLGAVLGYMLHVQLGWPLGLAALAQCETVLAGAVYAPPTQEIVAAAPGQGAWFNGVRTYVSTTESLASATLLTTDARFPGRPQRQQRWEQLARATRIVRT